jgi:hypothetical protein
MVEWFGDAADEENLACRAADPEPAIVEHDPAT